MPCQHKIGRLDIAMDHPALMSRLQSQRRLPRQFAGQGDRQRPQAADQLANWQTVQILHHQVRPELINARVVSANHMVVPQQSDRPHLSLEALDHAGGLDRHAFQRTLDRPQLMQHLVTCQKHHAEASAIELAEDFMARELPGRSNRGNGDRRLAGDHWPACVGIPIGGRNGRHSRSRRRDRRDRRASGGREWCGRALCG